MMQEQDVLDGIASTKATEASTAASEASTQLLQAMPQLMQLEGHL